MEKRAKMNTSPGDEGAKSSVLGTGPDRDDNVACGGSSGNHNILCDVDVDEVGNVVSYHQ